MPRTLLPPRPFIPAPNCASVEIFYSVNSVVAENVFHVFKGSPFTGAQLITLRGVVDAWDAASWIGSRTTTCSIFRYRCKALDTNGSPMDDYYLPTPRVGSGGGTLLPANVTVAFKAATGLGGRSYRGRWYWVGMSTSNLQANSNLVAVASANGIAGALNGLRTSLAASGFTQCVLSYAHDKAWRTTAVPTAITDWLVVDYNIDSQRRRLTGRGI